jgi:hypothetical protein
MLLAILIGAGILIAVIGGASGTHDSLTPAATAKSPAAGVPGKPTPALNIPKLPKTAALAPLRKSFDKVENKYWYYDKSTPPSLGRNDVYLYMGHNGTEPESSNFLRMVAVYHGDDWVFFNKLIFLIDGQRTEFLAAPKHENDSTVYEYTDTAVEDSDLPFLVQLANGKEVIVRFEGNDHRKDFTMSTQQKKAVMNVLTAYESLAAS